VAPGRRKDDLRESLDEQLKRVRAELDRLTTLFSSYDPTVAPARVSADWIRGMLEARRRRSAVFGSLFADPAWDMLLELYAVQLEGKRAAVSDLCKVSAVPYTTALRWIGRLEDAGLVVRTADGEDKRRIWVALSPTGDKRMKQYFRNADAAAAAI
jgi:DNA-binding MarR family transcriptional regulator